MAEVGGQSSGRERGLEPPADRVSECIRLLGAVRALCRSLEEALVPFDLMLRDYELLHCLPGRALSQAAIVRELEMTKVSVSRGVRRLNARGWVSVSVSSADKRVSSVALTDPGAERLDRVEAHIAQFLAPLAAALDEEERRLLGRVNGALQRFRHGQHIDCARAPERG